jgi:universal stress protein E
MQDRINIMVILDAAHSRSPALLRAMALALKTNASLSLFSFEYDPALVRLVRHGFDLGAYLKGREQELEEFAAGLRAEGFEVRTRAVWGHLAATQIIISVLAGKPDFVIKDVHSEPVLRRILFTPLDWHLLRGCPAPLMLVRKQTNHIPRHILAAVDPLDEHDRPHELNDRIMNFSAALAMQCDAQVEVAHAFDYIPMPTDPEGSVGWALETRIYDGLRAQHLRALQKLGHMFGVSDQQLHLLDGNPVKVLAEFVRKRHIDLLVMGTTYRTTVERLMMGSTAEGLLEHLDCDVLALKPAGFREQLILHFEHQTQAAA